MFLTGALTTPTIMEVEKRSLHDDRFLYNGAIFHFHRWGRLILLWKGNEILWRPRNLHFPKILMGKGNYIVRKCCGETFGEQAFRARALVTVCGESPGKNNIFFERTYRNILTQK